MTNYYGFGKFNNEIAIAKNEGEKWSDIVFSPVKEPRYSPAVSGIGYGNYLFEGCKAVIGKKGNIFLHRPDEHYGRMQVSSARMAMSRTPYPTYKKAIKMVTEKFRDMIPGDQNGFLYIQPRLLESTDSFNPYSNENYDFVVLSAPAISDPTSCINVFVETDSCKSSKGGLGSAKVSSNYAQTRLSEYRARELGYDTSLWLDQHSKFIEEFSTMTFLAIINGVLCSPRANDNIINGVTKRTLFAIAEEARVPVSESQVSITGLVQSIEMGYDVVIMGCSTAKGIVAAKSIRYGKQKFTFPKANEHPLFCQLREKLWAVYRGEYLPKLTNELTSW